jgi:predicted transcriptional regulator
LTDFLEGLKAKLITEHQQHLDLYNQQRQQCKDEFAFRDSEINDAQSALDISNEHRALCEGERERAENLEDLAEQALTIYQTQLDNLNTNRANQIAVYKGHSASLADALAAIEETIDYLNEFELKATGVIPQSFLQLVNVLLAVSVKTGHTHHVLPVYNKLLQTHSKQNLNVNDIADLREIIVKLKANIQEANVALEDQEAQDKQIYDDTASTLTGFINKLNNQIAQSDLYIGKMNDCVTQEVSIETLASGKIQRNTDLLSQAHVVCDDADAEFQQAESARTNQIELLGQLENAIQTLEAEYQENLFPEVGTLVSIGA